MSALGQVAESLSFVGTHIANVDHTLDDLLPVLRTSKGMSPTQNLLVYEEVEFEASVPAPQPHPTHHPLPPASRSPHPTPYHGARAVSCVVLAGAF